MHTRVGLSFNIMISTQLSHKAVILGINKASFALHNIARTSCHERYELWKLYCSSSACDWSIESCPWWGGSEHWWCAVATMYIFIGNSLAVHCYSDRCIKQACHDGTCRSSKARNPLVKVPANHDARYGRYRAPIVAMVMVQDGELLL